MLEEMDTRFGGVNHVDKGGDLMGVEDAHHADVDHTLEHVTFGKQAHTEQREVSH